MKGKCTTGTSSLLHVYVAHTNDVDGQHLAVSQVSRVQHPVPAVGEVRRDGPTTTPPSSEILGVPIPAMRPPGQVSDVVGTAAHITWTAA